MSVLLETSLGDIVIDLETERAPIASTNFIKLCKLKAYNWSLFHTITQGFTAVTGGNAAGDTDSGVSAQHLSATLSHDTHSDVPRFFTPEMHPKLKHSTKGRVSFVCSDAVDAKGNAVRVAASQFFFTLADEGAGYLNGVHAVFGKVVEGLDVLDALNAQQVDHEKRPFRDIRIKHTIILDDPFPDPPNMVEPPRSPSPPPEMLNSTRIGDDEDLFPDVDPEILEKESRDREAAARALTLEMIGDLPFAEIRPPENILFVCKLHPVTRDEDLELIFSRFGEIRSCEIIRDKKTQESLSYAFIDFEKKEAAEEAYFKMDNVLIDDRRIHVDFSQSVSKLHHDFLGGKRRELMEDEEFGGKGLQRKKQYRDGDDGGGGRMERRQGSGYDLVFEHEGDLAREKKRARHQQSDDVRADATEVGDTNRHRTEHRKDGREERDRHRQDRTSGRDFGHRDRREDTSVRKNEYSDRTGSAKYDRDGRKRHEEHDDRRAQRGEREVRDRDGRRSGSDRHARDDRRR
ncbi:hypothetical protein CcCBS67573_g04881 [Chytriomyces confervae]|uniref:Peptidyl-prolyl cis-trans isomerase n=1 Tax=Chytriomyces confervae TaxID=246404 RepID=A0A507FE43_9FUNG|nr:hypothetical protein CcCBS67573_g04881 [Chytriomyces confervae]